MPRAGLWRMAVQRARFHLAAPLTVDRVVVAVPGPIPAACVLARLWFAARRALGRGALAGSPRSVADLGAAIGAASGAIERRARRAGVALAGRARHAGPKCGCDFRAPMRTLDVLYSRPGATSARISRRGFAPIVRGRATIELVDVDSSVALERRYGLQESRCSAGRRRRSSRGTRSTRSASLAISPPPLTPLRPRLRAAFTSTRGDACPAVSARRWRRRGRWVSTGGRQDAIPGARVRTSLCAHAPGEHPSRHAAADAAHHLRTRPRRYAAAASLSSIVREMAHRDEPARIEGASRDRARTGMCALERPGMVFRRVSGSPLRCAPAG